MFGLPFSPSTTSAGLAMLFLLLVYSLTRSNPIDASPMTMIEPRADLSCTDLNNCRNIWSIIWSCFSTIFLCTWITLHPNITVARDTRSMGWFKKSMVHQLLDFMKNKLPLFLCGLLVPEYILGWAIRQYLKAGDIERRVPGWTRTHGFFLIMGGFHLYRLPNDALSKPFPSEFQLPTEFGIVEPLTPHSREDEVAEHPLDFADLSIRALAYLSPTEAEIKDKGKADTLTKAIAVGQTLWFISQCIARGLTHLPLTEIEVVTLAYTVVNIFISYFWWDKPKDVGCPVRVYKTLESGQVKRRVKWSSGAEGILEKLVEYIGGRQDFHFQLSEEVQVPMFWSGRDGKQQPAMLVASILGIAFGATHFIAWNSEFPTHIELLLWRVSCITIISGPLNLTVFYGIVQMGLRNNLLVILRVILMAGPVTALLYVFTRIATLVIAFTTLRALPSDAFKTVDWTTFIPHL